MGRLSLCETWQFYAALQRMVTQLFCILLTVCTLKQLAAPRFSSAVCKSQR
jgi:hypothetical protein